MSPVTASQTQTHIVFIPHMLQALLAVLLVTHTAFFSFYIYELYF